MHEKESQEPPELTSEHVKSQNFLGACPQTPSYNSYCRAPLFCTCPGLPQILSVALSGYVQTAHKQLAAILCRCVMLLKSQQKSLIGKQHRTCHIVSDVTEQNSHDAQLLPL